jgi:conjugative transfer signal peptidase TraF
LLRQIHKQLLGFFRSRWVYALAVLSVLAWTTGLVCWLGGIRMNFTASLPLGLYLETTQPTDLVSFCLEGEPGILAVQRLYVTRGTCPTGGTPLLKKIAARPGDLVLFSSEGVCVNGVLFPNTQPLLLDSTGRSMPHFPFGQYLVSPNTYWVISTYDRRSFDSRYYGPIPERDIQAHMQPLLVLR